ncbi:MAG: hypothetical protein ACREIA_16410 [Opitutaceae bacterium]
MSADGSIIVGRAYEPTGEVTSFLWREPTGFSYVDICDEGIHDVGGPESVDNTGAVVGSTVVDSFDPDWWMLATRWTSFAGIQLLGVFPDASIHRDVARAVSSDGAVIVGEATYNEAFDSNTIVWDHTVAFRWTTASGLVSLGFLPGGSWSRATDVSANGVVVVGLAESAISDHGEAFRWSGRIGMAGLGKPSGAYGSRANSISGDAAFIVGEANFSTGYYDRAMIWDAAHGCRLLRPLLESVPSLSAALNGWNLREAVGVASNASYVFIAGNGTNPAGNAEGWRVRLPRGLVTQ